MEIDNVEFVDIQKNCDEVVNFLGKHSLYYFKKQAMETSLSNLSVPAQVRFWAPAGHKDIPTIH